MIRFTKIDHVAVMIPTGQQAAARQFYGDLLQLKEIPGQHPRNAIWYEMADIQLHLVEEERTTELLSGRHPAFVVESLESAKSYLQSHGVGIAYTSKIEGRERAFFRDPFGNRVEMIEFDE